MSLDRRSFLSAAALLAASPLSFADAATERRFVFIIQRGAADGLNSVIPYAEPAYAGLRGALAIDPATALKLDGTFALHPALRNLHAFYAAGQAGFFHAVASPYRDRSHFDGQNVLETGGSAPYQVRDGWMNRLLGLLQDGAKDGANSANSANGSSAVNGKAGIAFSPAVPLALRGPVEVTTYATSALPQADDDLMLRVEQLYAKDAQLHGLWSAAIDARGMAGGIGGNEKRQQDPTALGRMAAGFLARGDGPRIAMIETGGWDTHSGQNARLTGQLKALDNLIAGLHGGLGPVWSQTVVLVATEFGRTVAANGTGGTDHGTGAAAMLAGGAVQGGRVVADWPGLGRSDLHEGRDLKPTLGLDALVAAVCAEAFRLDPVRTASVLFPNAPRGRPLPGLLRAG